MGGCAEPVVVERDWTAMDQPAHAQVYMVSEADAEAALDEMQNAIERFEALLDADGEDSELRRLNREASGGYYEVRSDDLYRCLRLALDYAKLSHGAFDPTIGPLSRLYSRQSMRLPTPTEIDLTLERVGWDRVVAAPEARSFHFRRDRMELDLGGLTKGFALDVAARVFARPGSRGGLLRLGNNIYAWREPPGGESWTVELPDPRSPGRLLGRVRTANRGIAISGHPESGRPRIWDARTGRPSASNLLAAVALADSAAEADALSTALFVAGSTRGADLLARTRRTEAILVVHGDGSPYVLVSTSLTGLFELSPELEREVDGRVRYLLPPSRSLSE